MDYSKIFKKILVDEKEIQNLCKKLGQQIQEDYKDKEPAIFLGLLKGCHPFMSDLLKNINLKLEVDYMDVSSYFGSTTIQTDVQIIKDMTTSVKGRDVVIVEDIVDSGHTIKKVKELLEFRKAKSVEIVTIVDKPEGRKVDLKPKYVGKVIPNEFIIGYGLDYNEYYRNFNVIGIPKEEIIEETNEK